MKCDLASKCHAMFRSFSVGGSSAFAKSEPCASLALMAGCNPFKASRGQSIWRVGSFQRMVRSLAGS